MFRILALEILSPRDDNELLSHVPDADDDMNNIALQKQRRYQSVVRVYDDGVEQLLRFYRDIDANQLNRTEEVVSNGYPFVPSFYDAGDVKVSVSAIVGMNGSGKSTILDIFLRIMNNVAYALRDGIDNNDSFDLHYAECVFARLYLETPEGYFVRIQQEDHDLEISVQIKHPNGIKKHLVCSFNNEKGGAKYYGKLLTPKHCQIILSKLFYTIVVNHAAYSYNICDYRLEWVDYDEQRTRNFEQIHSAGNEPKEPIQDGSEETLRKDDEELCWIGSLFHKNDSYQTPIVLNPYRRRGNIDYNREKQLLNDRIFLMLTYNKDVIAEMLEYKEPHSFEFRNIGDFLPNSYKGGFHRCRKIFNALNDLKAFSREEVDPADSKVKRSVRMSNTDIYDKIDRISDKIIAEWEKCVGVRLNSTLSVNTSKDRIAALNYLVYKTIKSSYYYSDFREYSDDLVREVKIDELVKDLYCNSTHITLKLRRVLAFLLFCHYGVDRIIEGNKHTSESLLDDFNKNLDRIESGQKNEYKCKVVVREVYTEKDYKPGQKTHDRWIREELLPAPHVQTILWLELPNGDKQTFDYLSSGEKQLIYAMSAVVYQLHHLNSAGEGKIQYSCANLIFDEVDLYFHPEYQRMLVDYILRVIGKLNMDKIKNINIMLATHSPFVLSDIPKNNILYLERGRDVSDDVDGNTLGANINDALANSFFLKHGFIGEYAKKKIKSMMKDMQENKSIADAKWEDYEKLINNVGDPYLQKQLMMVYTKYRFGGNRGLLRSWLKEKLEEVGE